MRKIIRIAALALLAFVFSGRSYPAVDSIALGIEKSVVEFNLSNGMKWLLMKRGTAPVFAGIIQIRVGGIEEEEGKTGLAHMFEHMAFKGTDDISPGELWDAFVTNGAADLNAYTSKDVTAYYAKMPSSKLALWLYLNSEMIRHPVMRDFFSERDVVLEELIGKIENNPVRKMDQALLATAFTKSPYRWPTIGAKEDVAKLKPEDLEAFRKKYYIPARMVGAIVGNFDVESAKRLITKYFGSIPPKADIAGRFPKEEGQKEARYATVAFDASPMMRIAYHKPTLPSYDDYVFDLIEYLLCNGDDSRLKRELVYKKRLVRGIGCDTATPGARLDNLFVITAEPMKGHSYKEVRAVIETEIHRLKSEPVPEGELERAKNNLMKDFVFGLAANEAVAHTLAYFQTVAGDFRYIARHLKVIDKISAADIRKTASKYLVTEDGTVIELVK